MARERGVVVTTKQVKGKFGEHIQKAAGLSEPEFCKHLTPRESDQETVEGGAEEETFASERIILASDKQETLFFKTLQTEVKKSSDLFKIAELQLSERLTCLLNAFAILQNCDRVPLRDGVKYHTRLKQACVNFYKETLLLEDFAMINYTAVSKLLKKHDRWSGFRTREKFMANIMNKEPIAECLYLFEMLREVEDIFAQLEEKEAKQERRMSSTDIAKATNNMDEDLRTCIEAILDMRRRSLTMQREEFGPAGCSHERACNI